MAIFYFFYNLGQHSRFINRTSFGLSQYSLSLGLILVLIALIFFFFTHKNWKFKNNFERAKELFIIGASVVSAYIVTFILKTLVHAPRPFVTLQNIHPLVSETPYDSFPSGHATVFFALATVIYCYDKKWGIVFFILAILIALSRVVSGVHYPGDVLAGAAIGIAVSYIAFKALSKMIKKEK